MIVVRFMGGLGNQMFQYALYRKLVSQGKAVCADLSYYEYEKAMPFMLLKAFPQIKLNMIDDKQYVENMIIKHQKRGFVTKVIHKLVPIFRYIDSDLEDSRYRFCYLKRKNGILAGYWQSERYWQDIKEQIISDLQFDILDNRTTKNLADEIIHSEAVSLHIRRGDYLEEDVAKIFGNICTLQYYKNAIEYMLGKNRNVKFYVFSNDTKWVKDNLKIENAVYVSDLLEKNTPDWYEMYLMSVCKHNIIANSTFSWWGAYLNTNKGKIVIAPRKWSNVNENKDICPKDWVRLEGK